MPYRAPGPGDDRVDWILFEINKAQTTLDARIEEAQALPDTEPSKAARISRLNAMKREVDTAFIDLEKNVGIWADRDIRNFYRRGHGTAAAQLPGAGYSFTLPHREALDLISHDAYDDVATRLQQVRSGFGTNVEMQKIFESLDPSKVQTIQEQGRSAVAQMLLTGEDPRKISKRLAEDLWSQGVQITDAGGRTWNPEAYTRMLVRTKSANAYNAGSMNKYAEEGVTRVRVFDGIKDDEECASANGEIWSLRYAMNHVIQHPNCRRAFGPEQGEGDVDKDTEQNFLVSFDRLELGVGALVALRAFRTTGEVNVSSTLARLVIEGTELALGIPLPFIDVFLQGFFSGSFKSVDSYVESLIDPFLYSVGVIRNVPPRAGIRALTKPENVLDRITEGIKKANREAFGVEFHPEVRGVLDKLDELTTRVVGGFLPPTTGERGGLKYIDWVAAHVSGTRYGEITAEVLRRAKADEIGDLQRIWRESADYIDDMREVRRAYINTIIETRVDAEQVFRDLDALLLDMQRLAGSQTDIRTLPRVIEFLGKYEIEEIDIERIITYWSRRGRAIQLSDYEVRKMREIFDQAYEVRTRALMTIEQMDEALLARTRRQLLMAAPSGPDFPSEANTLWDLAEFESVVDDMASRLAVVTGSTSGFDPDIKDMFKSFFRMLEFDPSDVPQVRTLRQTLEGFVHPNFTSVGDLVDIDDIPDQEAALRFVMRILDDIHIEVENGRGVLVLFGDVLDDRQAREVAAVLDWLDESFWDMPARWRAISDLHWDADLINRHLPVGSTDTGAHMKRIWRDYKNSIRDNELEALRNPYGQVGEVLTRAYSKSNVQVFGERAANGTMFEVLDPTTGQKVLVKRIVSGHSGGTVPALTSMQITNYLAEVLGDIEAIPTRFIQLTDNGTDWLVVMPYVEDTVKWSKASDDLIRDDVLRKFALFDALSLEGDPHAGNFLVNSFTETSVVIDRELSFGAAHKVDAPDFGMRGAPRDRLDKRMFEAWIDGDDIDFGRNAPPVRLHETTLDEVAAMTGYDVNDLETMLQNPHGALTFFESTGIVISDDLRAYIPTGRVGYIEDFADGFPHLPSWWTSTFPTETEFRMIEDLVDGDLFDTRFYGDVREHLADVFEEASNDARSFFIEQFAPGANFEDALNVAAETITENVRTRAERMLRGGTLNISGGLTKHIDPRTGKELQYGEVVKFTHRETGEEIEGLVVNLFQGDFETDDIAAVIRPHIGLGKSSGDLVQENLSTRIVRLDDWDWGEAVGADLAAKLGEYRRVIDDYNDAFTVSRVNPDIRARPVLDEFGIRIGEAEETIEVVSNDGAVLMRLVGNDGAEKLIPFNDFVETPAVRDLIDSEIRKLPPEFRPKRVKISFSKLTTEDGRSAFGMFDPETGDFHLSVAPLFDTPQLSHRPTAGWTNSWFYDAAIDDWGMSKASVQHWIGTLNVEGVQHVIRHELGHAVETGIERQNFNRWSLAILEQLREEFPDLNITDLRATAGDLIPEGFDRTGFPNDLAALIAYRAGLVEDVANTNLVFEAKELLEAGMENRVLPDWARAVYAGILREEPEAHHELFAELWKRLNDLATEAGPRFTPSQMVLQLSKDLGVEEDTLLRFMTRNGDLDLPVDWDMSGEGFRRWMTEVLSPAADRIIPLEKNRNRLLWKAERYSIEDIRTRVLHTPAEEGGGGITINLVTGEEPDAGYAVAAKVNQKIYRSHEIQTDDQFDAAVRAYIKEHKVQLSKPEWELGLWVDSKGDLYIDTTRIFDDKIDAAVFGFRERQKAMFDLNNFEDINLLDDYEDIYQFLDDLPDFDLPYDEFLARIEKVGGVVRQIGTGSEKVLEDQFERGGIFRVMSLDWMDESYRTKILDSLETRYNISLTVEKGRTNLQEVLERGMELYAERPDLRDEFGNFYFRWRDDFIQAATDTLGRPIEISMPQIAAAAARMSPALRAEANYDIVLGMVDVLSNDRRVNGRIIEAFKGIQERSKFFTGVKKRIAAGTASQKDLAYAARQQEILDELRPGRKINKLSDEARIRAVAGALIVDGRTPIQASRTWTFYEDAAAVLLGERTPGQILTDTKVRPFNNNILDPADLSQNGENTIDFIMAEAFFHARGFNNIDYTAPVVTGISAGLRPVISDTIRVMYEAEWRDRLGLVSVSQFQAHIWGLWRYGVEHGWWDDLPTIAIRKS